MPHAGSVKVSGDPNGRIMNLFYDERDDASHQARGTQILYWLDDLGAKPLSEATPRDAGFLFAGARPIADYHRLLERLPGIRDRAEQRAPLLRLDSVLDAMAAAGVDVPTPRTWRIPLDAPMPRDLTFPLFVRTAFSSLKLGGNVSRVKTVKQLESEIEELRRLLGWDALILARAWCDFAEAGQCVYGSVPQEIRTWIVDNEPHAWSFHYMNVIESPKGFPPTVEDLQILRELSACVSRAFQSRCIVADFARTKAGDWIFVEAGPGSCAGTAHEGVFKSVAAKLAGEELAVAAGAVGGSFED
jgi:hypothetical protein